MKNTQDVKKIAQSLRRVLLDTKDIYLGRSESLEVVSKIHGVRDWNTFSAALKKDQPAKLKAQLSDCEKEILGYYKDSLGYVFELSGEPGSIRLRFLTEEEESFFYTLHKLCEGSYSVPGLYQCIDFHKTNGSISTARANDGKIDMFWERVDKTFALSYQQDIRERIQQSRPSSDSESIILRFVEGLGKNDPNYDMMGQTQAQAVDQQLPQLNEMFKRAGPFQQIAFIGIQDDGSEIFHLTYEKRLIRLSVRIEKGTGTILSSWIVPGG